MPEATVQEVPEKSTKGVILVVDDDALLLEMATVILRSKGMLIKAFPNGERALEFVEGNSLPPRLLITDFSMPGMTGLELIERVRQIYPGMKCILTSGTLMDEIHCQAMARPDYFLPKPYDIRIFIETVASALSEAPLANMVSSTEVLRQLQAGR